MILWYSSPTQHHSFFRNLPRYHEKTSNTWYVLWSILKDKCTTEGYDIDNLIESSQHNLSTNFTPIPKSAGLLAGDEECYDLFSELIDLVIGEIHIYFTDSAVAKKPVNLIELTTFFRTCNMKTKSTLVQAFRLSNRRAFSYLHFKYMQWAKLKTYNGETIRPGTGLLILAFVNLPIRLSTEHCAYSGLLMCLLKYYRSLQ